MRAYVYQARSLIGSDDSGLSDPFARIVIGEYCKTTQVGWYCIVGFLKREINSDEMVTTVTTTNYVWREVKLQSIYLLQASGI